MRCLAVRSRIVKRNFQIPIVLLILGTGLWATTAAIQPQIAQAETHHIELSLERQPNETFSNLVRRAENAAGSVAQQRFNQDPQATDVSVTVIAQNQGAVAPILSLRVNRSQWLRYPNPQHWATYYRSAEALLQFKNIATSSPTSTTTINSGRQSSTPTNNSVRQQPVINTQRQIFNSPPIQTGNTNATASGQPTARPGIINPAPSSSYTPAPGSGMKPIAPVAAPVYTPSNPPTPIVPNNSTGTANISNQNPTSTPLTPLPPLPNNGTTNNTTPRT